MRVSLDGRHRCLNNILIERIQCSLKGGAVNFQELADGFKAPAIIADRIVLHLRVRPHSASDHIIRFVVEARSR